jgi:hypothetical protein
MVERKVKRADWQSGEWKKNGECGVAAIFSGEVAFEEHVFWISDRRFVMEFARHTRVG